MAITSNLSDWPSFDTFGRSQLSIIVFVLTTFVKYGNSSRFVDVDVVEAR